MHQLLNRHYQKKRMRTQNDYHQKGGTLRHMKLGFTLVELIIVMAIMAILMTLALPNMLGYTQQASEVQLANDARLIQQAIEQHMVKAGSTGEQREVLGEQIKDNGEPFDADETGLSVKIYNISIEEGEIFENLDDYAVYEINWESIEDLVSIHTNKEHFVILENSPLEVGILDPGDNNTQKRLTEGYWDEPVAEITMNYEGELDTNTEITWGHESSYVPDKFEIKEVDWQNRQSAYSYGDHTVRLRIHSSNHLWSDWVEKTFNVEALPPTASISMSPNSGLDTGTNVSWDYSANDPQGLDITNVEWDNRQSQYSAGNHTTRVRVQNEAGVWSDWDSETFSVEEEEVAPNTPGSFSSPSSSIDRGSTITVNWGNTSSWGTPSTNRNYRLEVQYNNGSWQLARNSGSTSSTSHSVSSNSSYNSIRYRVRAESDGGNSSWKYSNTLTISSQSYTDLGYRSPSSNMTAYRSNNGEIYRVRTTGDTSAGTVWGSLIYTDDSRIGRAAVHAGRLNNGQTGYVYIEILTGRSSYSSTTRNGVTTNSWGSWSGSYRFVAP